MGGMKDYIAGETPKYTDKSNDNQKYLNEIANMRGFIRKAKERKTDKSPTHTGIVKINGIEYWVSGWVMNKADNNTRYFSLAFNKKEQLANNPDELDEDIPF